MPRSPGRTPEHAPPPGPRSTPGTASGPHAPLDRPAGDPSCPAGSASDAQTTASATRRSTEACRCSGCSDPDGAPTPRSGHEATRSPTQDAQSSHPSSRTRTPATGSNGSEPPIQRLTHFSIQPSTHPGQLRQNMTSAWSGPPGRSGGGTTERGGTKREEEATDGMQAQTAYGTSVSAMRKPLM